MYLVGAGPGDPDLITVKGRRTLETADAILFDHLAPEALLDLAPPHAERLYVGKKKSAHAFTQEEICEMLIERARRGLNVVRLKGGDPFIFGRGGEEAEALASAGIAFEVVPGVTVPLGIAAYTGVPLTHREHTSAVTFVTGHAVDSIDWQKVGHAETLVIFMGLTTFPEIARELIDRGRSPETPAMAVRWATRPDQETLTGTLATLPARIVEYGMRPPATIIVGEVVKLREKLDWYERLPLFGKRVVVTRARGQAETLSARLRSLGAEAIELPTIEIRPPADPGPLDRAIAELSSYDWLIFTSANGVRFFLDRLGKSPVDWRALRAKICAIGPATRSALEALHLKVDLMGKEYVAEGLVAAFAGFALDGKRVLLPRAAVARDLVPMELARRGARVDIVEAYRTVIPEEAPARAREILGARRRPDCLTFTSSSTVQNLVASLQAGSAEPDASAILAGVKVASIGPVTTRTARELGIEVTAQARVFTVDGLVEAILAMCEMDPAAPAIE
ncbi:MAG TPA: uroporphyrinogen-III C-methyltransferase [Bryobacteraceae bacterium]|nr:uroporphyrinogen-III C-methyltransferase [Bryobacteraceae bacterium]